MSIWKKHYINIYIYIYKHINAIWMFEQENAIYELDMFRSVFLDCKR